MSARFNVTYTIGRGSTSISHLDPPSQVSVTVDGREFMVEVLEDMVTISTRKSHFPARSWEVLGAFDRMRLN